jgi:hypothetical protein
MDPIKRAMTRLADDAEAFWRAHPGRLLALVAAEDDRREVVATLRSRERAADNRRPFVVYEAPFVEEKTYFPGLVEALGRHYEAVRQGVATEGVALPPFAGNDGTVPSGVLSEGAAMAMGRAAHLLGEGFDGIAVALVPEHVADPAAWRSGIGVLATRRWPERVRVAVLAPPGGPLSGVLGLPGARFHVDPGKVLGFARQVAARQSAGPETPETTRDGAVTEPGAGAPVPRTAERLRLLVLDAAEALATGQPARAATAYREARISCQAENLPEQEAAVLMGLGGACLLAEEPRLAAEAYRQAAGVAQQMGTWPLVCQAWLGMGGASLADQDHVSAVIAFRAAAAAAERAGVVALQIEALRMQRRSLLHLGREDAIAVWKEAVTEPELDGLIHSD